MPRILNDREFFKRIADYIYDTACWGIDPENPPAEHDVIRIMEERLEYVRAYWSDVRDWQVRRRIRLVEPINASIEPQFQEDDFAPTDEQLAPVIERAKYAFHALEQYVDTMCSDECPECPDASTCGQSDHGSDGS